MHETSKAVMRRLHDSRFATRYFVGHGIDVGAGPDALGQYQEQFPRMQSCRSWDLKDGDAQLLQSLADQSCDFVHSSHCLEHMRDPAETLHHWLRVLKPGGHLVVLVPDEDLYEQGVFPSTFNIDHKWTFTTCKQASWSAKSINLSELLARFASQAQLLKMETLDATFRFQIGQRFDQTLTPVGECAIEFVLRKLPADAAPAVTLAPAAAAAAADAAPTAPAEPTRPNQLQYSAVKPIANYSPWLSDPDFLGTLQATQGSTLVDLYRLWELWCLVDEVRDLPGAILEVGVWRGGTGALMARRAGKTPVVLCDTFTGVVKAGAQDQHYQGGEHADASIDQVQALLRTVAPAADVRILVGIFPEQTGAQVAGQQFKLVHIDVDVYESARDVLDFVWPHMPAGGVVVYDDYGFSTCTGIALHVDEQRGKPDRLVVHNLNGHALLIKR
jgi:hypothetical protein